VDDPAFTNVDRGVLGVGICSLAKRPNQGNAKVTVVGKQLYASKLREHKIDATTRGSGCQLNGWLPGRFLRVMHRP
jgi:hypothetical protein